MPSADSHAAQMAAAIVVAAHGRIEVKVCCNCTSVGPQLAAEGLAGAHPPAGAPLFVAVGSRMADEMQPAPRPVDRERAAVAGSALDQPTAVAAAVMGARLPHSGLQPAGKSEHSESQRKKGCIPFSSVIRPCCFCISDFSIARLT